MKNRFRLWGSGWLWLWALILLAGCSRGPKPLSADAPPEQIPDLSGEYIVNGFDPTGIEYGGRLRIRPGEQPGEYSLQWLISGGLQEGEGKVEDNHLQVTWRSLPSPGRAEQSGTAAYTITIAGELYGPKRLDGYSQEGRETAYPNTPQNMSR